MNRVTQYLYCLMGVLCVCIQGLFSAQPRTVFIPRSFSSSALYTDGFSFLAKRDTQHNRALLLGHTAIYQDSYNGSKSAPFFLGSTNREISIAQDESGVLNSEWFHIESAEESVYASTLSVTPERSAVGVCVRAQYFLDQCLNGLWVGVALPVVHVTHTLNPVEVKKSGTLVADDSQFGSVVRALDWDNWRAGKWSSTAQSITGVDDIVTQIGVDIDGPRGSLQQLALELVIPVGSKATGQYLFEPLLGMQGSLAIGISLKTVSELFKLNENCQLLYVGHVGYRYHTRSTQSRLFDLKGQPFSRYLIYMDTDLIPNDTNVALKASNGTNFFLRECLVTPGATGQSVNALQCRLGRHHINAGYMYWWRVAEQLSFAAPMDRTFAVPSPQGVSVGGSPVQVWMTGAQITDRYSAADPAVSTSPSVVRDIEFDIDSGAMPYVASHTLFLDYSSSFVHKSMTCTVRLGGGYEFSQVPAVLDTLHIWCGIGITI
jgi:hypothetical protein